MPHHSSAAARRLFPVYLWAAQRLREHHGLIRHLFGVRIPPGMRVSWDWTTLVLRKALRQRLRSGHSALEVGVGQGALLSLFLVNRRGVTPDAVDILPERVRSSTVVAKHNDASIRIWQSDLFCDVENRYDCVFFNAAYIPTEFGEAQDLTARGRFTDDRAWDGGGSGTDIMARFLAEAPAVLNPGGQIMLGLSNFYVSDEQISRLIAATPLTLVARITGFMNPSAVYVLTCPGD